ncbi:Protein of unknown function [Pyronema omphalodes CBS 100304]|uniref:Uncharacterized protein n=1 Tax=Pyronema omphalodes (strain CBS 100304) TaxID=1076935 RepID=U4L2K3_PYROM|nr:Protein of unknown function [Pyronema omphalodes CBS 100304]
MLELIKEENERFKWIHAFLFKTFTELSLSEPIFSNFSAKEVFELTATACALWDCLLDIFRAIKDMIQNFSLANNPLQEILTALSESNKQLQAQLRRNTLNSGVFMDEEVLKKVENGESESAKELGLDWVAKPRPRNMKEHPEKFAAVNKNEDEDDKEEYKVRSGKYDKDNMKFLTFPGKMNKTSVKPDIDAGGGCNLVNS